MKKQEAIKKAVTEALGDLAGPIIEWAKYDSKRLMSHCLGSCHAQFRIDNVNRDTISDVDVLAEVLRQVVEKVLDEKAKIC